MLSYSRGPELPLRSETVYQALAAISKRFPDRLALVYRPDAVRWTYNELLQRVDQTARGLAGLGLKAGDRVGIWAGSCPEWILLQFACPRVGIVLVNVNPAYRTNDLGYIIGKSKMRAIFHFPGDGRANYDAILCEVRPNHPLLEHDIRIGTESWSAMIANGRDAGDVAVDPHQVVNIQYTSGTTGNPKGVCLSHHNLVNNAWLTAQCLEVSENDCVCQTFPLYHTAGYTTSSLLALTTGAAFVLPSRMFDAAATLAAIDAEKVSLLYGVPSMFIAELEHPEFDRFNLSSLRAAVVGGAPCPVDLMKRMRQRLGNAQVYDVYGQTEASPAITISGKDDSLELRTTTIGRAMPNTEVKIADLITGETLPIGQQGELCARGYFVMKGYDEDLDATRRAVDCDGWLHTGDLALMLPNQYLHITGRAKDMIIRGGENIYPAEVENLLHSHSAVTDAHVLGLPDEKLGEIVVAWVRLRPGEAATEQEIRDFCNGKIAHFKIPQYVRFVDQFPMTASGKIQKFRIREMEIEMRQLQHAAKIQTA